MSAPRFFHRRLRALVEDSSPGFTLVELMAYAAVVVTTAAFLVPFTRSALNAMNLTSDARNVSSATQLAKMRAAADFTKARIYVELAAGTFRVQRWRKAAPAGWIDEGQISPLSPTVGFGFASLTAPPPNTQAAIAQAPPCLDDADQPIAATACIMFNSRGIPIDGSNAPTANGAFYLSDGATVFAITASAGGLVRVWRSNIGGAAWAAH